MRYKQYENAENLAHEQQAALRVQQHWRGLVRPAEQFLPYDRVLVDTDGSTAALVEIKVRTYPMQFFIERKYMISHSKVRSLCAAAKQSKSVPLIMVVCTDADFLIDLRDETGVNVRQMPAINDRWYDDKAGVSVQKVDRMNHNYVDADTEEIQWRAETMLFVAGHRFLPLFALPSLF
jgi:hypothetical protein